MNPHSQIPDTISLLNAAERTGLSEDTMRRACIAGDVDAFQRKKGGHWRVIVDARGMPVWLNVAGKRRPGAPARAA